MNSVKKLTAKEIKELKERPIDLSDIPELTDSQLKQLHPRNWQPGMKNKQITQL